MSPPSILIPAVSTSFSKPIDIYGNGRTGRQHFISEKEFARWSKDHPSVKLRPAGGDELAQGAPGSNKGKEVDIGKKEYKAPQHPVSHLLHTIPPRAPSRSSRSNILSYTLHLATTTRLSAFSTSKSSYDEQAIAVEEQKASGLYKLSGSLLRASRRDADTPVLSKSVERRVALASLVEELLSAPDKEKAVKRLGEESIIASGTVEAVINLKPLTSPDTTKLYQVQGEAKSVAQSLIDMKFAGEADEAVGEKPNRSGETVFGDRSAGASRLTSTPHMDYRIVRGQAMRTRAKEIFATSILPSTSTAWCRRHREQGCSSCPVVSNSTPTLNGEGERWSRHILPGQGLSGGSARKPLAEVVPAFLIFSAALLKDLQERASATTITTDALEYTINDSPDIAEVNINVTAAWYELVHSLAIQAALEGYLVDGWTGTEGLETLFNCGCGVWEGRGWAQRVEQKEPLPPLTPKLPRDRMDVDSDEESEEEEDEERERELQEEREKERARLVEAAHALFGTRDVAQADFERNMRDRVQEFLAVPEEGNLQAHLVALNAKYPLATFERSMVDFLEATTRLLGKPSLAKLEPVATPTGSVPISSEPDPYALTQFFSRTESDVSEDDATERSRGKRRRID